MEVYSIGEMAEKLGKSIRTLQNWDRKGILKAERTPSGRRYYIHKQLVSVLNKDKYKDDGSILDCIRDKTVLITGGTGSLGKKITERIVNYCKKVVIYSRCELKQHEMKIKFNRDNIRFVIGDVRDKNRLSFAMKNVDIVIHAAALKRVEVNYYNPTEGIKTNIDGTINVAESCISSGVSRALFVSSDKAAGPIIPYGFMKALGESCWTSFNNYSDGKTKFMASRYGNVIDSRGSFYHIIQQQKNNGLIRVTDPNMTRFYMTLDQAVDLNLFALSDSISGEIYIPKIKSANIMEFVKAFADDVSVEYIGLRGAEKIAECLITEHEMRDTYDCGEYYKIVPNHIVQYNVGWDRDRIFEKPIKPFKYTSDSNDVEKLSVKDLQEMINV